MNRKPQKLLLVLVAFSLGLSGCQKSEPEHEAASPAPGDVVVVDPQAAQSIGFTTVTVTPRALSQTIVTTGEIAADENRVFHINSFVSGRITRDDVSLGDFIRKGQTLASMQNMEVAKIQADYIHQLHKNEIDIAQAQTRLTLAQKNLEREKRLLEEGIAPRKDYQQALAEEALALQALKGLKEHATHLKSEASALLSAYNVRPGDPESERIVTESPIKAPRSGIITRKSITLGDMVTPETVMYEVADLSRVWLNIAVYPQDFSAIQKGQNVTFTTDSLPGQTFLGQIDYLQPATSSNSHTYLVRAFLDNPQGILKPGMFGSVKIDHGNAQKQLFVPEGAIQRYGRETFVFLPLGNHRFQKRTVVLGNKAPGGYAVRQGLEAGEQVVDRGSFNLKASLLKHQFAEEE